MCSSNASEEPLDAREDRGLFARLDSYESKGKGKRGAKRGRWMEERGAGLNGADVPRWVPESKTRKFVPKVEDDKRHVDMTEALEPEEEEFWHSGWSVRRRAVMNALAVTSTSPAAFSRFKNCGSRAWVWRNGKTGDVRVHADFCRSRFCVRCAARVGRRCRKTLETLTENAETRLITLTVGHVPSDTLAVLKDRLLAAFKVLRRGDLFKRRVKGGAYVLETKYNKHGGGWHPHLHVVCDASFLPAKQLRDEWRGLVGRGNVDVQRVRSSGGIARYVAKYVTKQFDHSVFSDPDRLIEAVQAFKGARLMSTFGAWRGVELQGEDEAFDKAEWKPLSRLSDVLELASQGAAHAIRILSILRGNGAETDVDPPPE